MNLRQKELLIDIVKRRAPDKLQMVEILCTTGFAETIDRNQLCHIINDEFLQHGLAPDFNATAFGVELEHLLDAVNRSHDRL